MRSAFLKKKWRKRWSLLKAAWSASYASWVNRERKRNGAGFWSHVKIRKEKTCLFTNSAGLLLIDEKKRGFVMWTFEKFRCGNARSLGIFRKCIFVQKRSLFVSEKKKRAFWLVDFQKKSATCWSFLTMLSPKLLQSTICLENLSQALKSSNEKSVFKTWLRISTQVADPISGCCSF